MFDSRHMAALPYFGLVDYTWIHMNSRSVKVASLFPNHPIVGAAIALTLVSIIANQINSWSTGNPAVNWITLGIALASEIFWGPAVIKWERQIMRSRKGLCRRCGHDLRASPDRCPECGTTAW